MEQNKTPFVSDEQINDIATRNAGFDETEATGIRLGMIKARDLYEPELRALRDRVEGRDRLIQELVDALKYGTRLHFYGAQSAIETMEAALAKAKELTGITPNTNDHA